MDLNKLTKKELVEYGESLDISLNIRDTKESLITQIERYEYSECDGCKVKVTDAHFLPDGYEPIHYIDDPSHRFTVKLCEACFNEWSDVPKGFKLEINSSTGGLWYRPLSKTDKKNIKEDTFFERWMMYFFVFAGIWLAIGISAFISDIFGLGFGDDIRRITWHIYNPFSDSINPYP